MATTIRPRRCSVCLGRTFLPGRCGVCRAVLVWVAEAHADTQRGLPAADPARESRLQTYRARAERRLPLFASPLSEVA